MDTYIIFPMQVVHELSVLANNISSDQGEFCTVPNIGKTNQNDLGIQSNSPKASSVTNSEPRQYEQGGLSNKGSSEERSSMPQVK